MITLYSYPVLFGVADNNPFGLKVFAFLKLAGLQFAHEHIFDAKTAPRGQLPYIVDDGTTVGDSDAIIHYVTSKHAVIMDSRLTDLQRTTDLLLRRTLDDLYWVMSYSRWRDDSFWPLFRDEMLRTHPNVTFDGMETARRYNFERYRYQGIGRYEPAEAYARGLGDLAALAGVMPTEGFLFGPRPASIDAAVYGFLANVYYFDIDTPLKRFVASHLSLVRHTDTMHAMVMK